MGTNLIAFPGPEARAVATAIEPVSERVKALLAPTRTSPRFTEAGEFIGLHEDWSPRAVKPADLPDLRRQLALLGDALRPADRAPLAARVLALLSHYREKDPLPPAVEAAIAEDWCDDLIEFPMWAVVEACKRWRQDPRKYRFRPHPNDIRLLCQDIVASASLMRERLEQLLDRAGGAPVLEASPAGGAGEGGAASTTAASADLRSRIRLLAETKRMPGAGRG